jgi:hypothetical protein
MKPLDDNQLDLLLSSHLKRQLDPLAGQAARRFLKHVATTPVEPASWWIRHRSRVAGAAAAMGLGLSLAFVAFLLRDQLLPASNSDQTLAMINPGQAISPESQSTSVSWWQTVDLGTVLLEDQTPARVLQRTQFEETRRPGPDGTVSTELRTPRQDIVFVELENP